MRRVETYSSNFGRSSTKSFSTFSPPFLLLGIDLFGWWGSAFVGIATIGFRRRGFGSYGCWC